MSLTELKARRPAQDADERPLNNLLRRLRREDYALLAPRLTRTSRSAGELLYNPGDNVELVLFPCESSLVSYLVVNEDGRDVETVLVGREGAIGGLVSLGRLPAYCKIWVKHPGAFMQMPVSALNDAKEKSGTLRYLFARYADCLLAQIFQSAACNAVHTIEQRTAKWIVAAIDRTGDSKVPITQEELAGMLGVGRSYASRVIQTLKAERVLETGRGSLLIRNVDALKARACLCNESVKSHFETVLEGLYPSADDPNVS